MNFKNIKLEKGMYDVAGKSFSQILEEIDPSEQYEGTAYAEYDAYQRQLKRFDIKVSGSQSSMVSKFFANPQSAVLYPEFLKRAIKAGYDSFNHLDDILACRVDFDGYDYRPLSLNSLSDTSGSMDIGEGMAMGNNLLKISSGPSNSVRKQGYTLNVSYESIATQKIDVFAVYLHDIGRGMARANFNTFIDPLITMAATIHETVNSASLIYMDLINVLVQYERFKMTTIITNPTMFSKMLLMEEFKNANYGVDFRTTGKLLTPFGATIISSIAVPIGRIITLDKNAAIGMVGGGEILLENGKLIENQLATTCISTRFTYVPFYGEAVKVIKLK